MTWSTQEKSSKFNLGHSAEEEKRSIFRHSSEQKNSWRTQGARENFQEWVPACFRNRWKEKQRVRNKGQIAQRQILMVFSPFADDSVTQWVWPFLFSHINWLLPSCSRQILRQTISYVKYNEITFIESRWQISKKGSGIIRQEERKVEKNYAYEIVVYSKAPDSANVPLAGSDDSSPHKDRVVGFSQQIRFLYFRRLPSRQIPILFYPQVSPTTSFKIFTIIMVIWVVSNFSV